MGKSLEELFEADQVKRLAARSPWNARRMHQKVFDEVGETLSNLTRDGKIHLKKSNWGYVHHVDETGSQYEHFCVSLNLSNVSQEHVMETVKCTMRVPRGFKGLVARSAWMILGEKAFIERNAAYMLRVVARVEAEHCQKNNIGPMPAIEALFEAQKIALASELPKRSKSRSSSI